MTEPTIPVPVQILPQGLSSREAKALLATHGANSIYRKKRLRPLVAFIKKFNSPLLLMLIGTAILSLFLGQKTNAVIILFMVLTSAVMDFINTGKSEAVAAKLVEQVTSNVIAWRDGKKTEVPLHEIVPGDVIELAAGNVIPADARLISGDDFFVNQSALTGESFPVEKIPHPELGDSAKEVLPSQEHILFMGTSVVTGFGSALILRTGGDTEFGKIADRLSHEDGETDFDRGIKQFSYFIVRLTFVMVICVFMINTGLHRGLLDSFLFALAIAVGLTPELLPVIMSVSLARGSLVMSEKRVIVKNLSAIQNFGGMNILCTDKTGTLTEDKISLVKCVDGRGKDSHDVLMYAYLSSTFQTTRRGPLDEAIRAYETIDTATYTKVDEIPFDFHRRRDSVIIDKGKERIMITKGAPENILAVSSSYQSGDSQVALSDSMRAIAIATYDALSADGFRVLAIARSALSQEARVLYEKEEEKDLIFVGFAAFLDPAKTSAGAAIRELQDLAIEVKIITGDSELLTKRICEDLNLSIRGMLTGSEIQNMSDAELTGQLEGTTVFARVSPEQKERIVMLLRKAGNVVGYMGDGINDAPVLKAADVGISVNNAVDVAKETADIILLDKSLEVLRDGVVEGRKTFQNTIKYIKMGFSSNFGNMFSMMAASAFLPFLPMLPSQILLNNFMYDMSQTTLSTDKTDIEDTRKPLRWNMTYFGKYVAVFGLVSSIFDLTTFYLLYKIFSLGEAGFQTGWFIESMATQILIIYVIRTKKVPFWKSLPSAPVVLSSLGVVFLAWILPYTPLGALLSFTHLPLKALIAIGGIVLAYLLVGEITKGIFYKYYPKAP